MTRTSKSRHPIAVAARKAKLTYEQIASQCDFSHGYLKQIASGIRKPSFVIADRIAGTLADSAGERTRLTLRIMRFPYPPLPVRATKARRLA